MNIALGYYLLPSVIVSSTALILMVFTAAKREHQYTSLFTSLGLLLALITQISQIGNNDHQSELMLFDATTTLLSALLIFVALLLSFLLYPWLETLSDPKEEYYLLFLLTTQGALIVCASNHLATFFLGLELMSLSLVALIAYPDRNTKALEAGIKYLVLSAFASAFMLMAIAIMYFYSGTLAIGEIAQQLPPQKNDIVYNGAIILLLVGIAFKLSLAPCHLWVADLFEGSPLPTAALLATLSKAAVFIVLIRFFSLGQWHYQTEVITIISIIAGASMIVGNFLALLQRNILRLLAYSSIAHFGYILLALLAMHPTLPLSRTDTLANEAAIYYLFAYLITVVGTFSALILLFNDVKTTPFTIDRLRGLFWEKPSTALVLCTLFLSLAGIPLTIGFVGKFYLTLAAVNAQLWWLLATLIVGSISGLFYYLRIILMMMEQPEETPEPPPKEIVCPLNTQYSIIGHIVLGTTILLIAGIGIFPGGLAYIIIQLVN